MAARAQVRARPARHDCGTHRLDDASAGIRRNRQGPLPGAGISSAVLPATRWARGASTGPAAILHGPQPRRLHPARRAGEPLARFSSVEFANTRDLHPCGREGHRHPGARRHRPWGSIEYFDVHGLPRPIRAALLADYRMGEGRYVLGGRWSTASCSSGTGQQVPRQRRPQQFCQRRATWRGASRPGRRCGCFTDGNVRERRRPRGARPEPTAAASATALYCRCAATAGSLARVRRVHANQEAVMRRRFARSLVPVVLLATLLALAVAGAGNAQNRRQPQPRPTGRRWMFPSPVCEWTTGIPLPSPGRRVTPRSSAS